MSPTQGRTRAPIQPHRAARSGVVAALGLFLLAGSPLPAGAATVAPEVSSDAGETLQVLTLNTQLWVGPNVLVVDLLDGSDARLPVRDLAVTARLTGPDGVTGAPFPLRPIQLVSGGPYWSEGRTQLDRVGPWTLAVEATDGDRTRSGAATFSVLPDDGTLPLGGRVPSIDTPTLESSGYDLATITTDPEPEPSFYWTSVHQALDAGRPFVLAFDSLAFRTSDACGGAVAHLRHLQKEFPGLLLIHAEPYATTATEGVLTLDPPAGPPIPAPWVLVVDGDGTLRAKLTDVFGSDELRAAVREIAPWAPGGH